MNIIDFVNHPTAVADHAIAGKSMTSQFNPHALADGCLDERKVKAYYHPTVRYAFPQSFWFKLKDFEFHAARWEFRLATQRKKEGLIHSRDCISSENGEPQYRSDSCYSPASSPAWISKEFVHLLYRSHSSLALNPAISTNVDLGPVPHLTIGSGPVRRSVPNPSPFSNFL
ncbi:hypothetical protein EVAR_78510_1 [Eumeta japonica]|uniref:Uncharacterized protein n=1 Tax=Eumeta variegata TaxID=151549 RepID=A0A4C1TYG2_EUMVA|nr:hypothetical protein EVAR_78510_1 [Eumeta japonica]